MTAIKPGDRVNVSEEARNVVICDFIGTIAGKTGYVEQVYERDNEAFIVAAPNDDEGSYVPLNLLQQID